MYLYKSDVLSTNLISRHNMMTKLHKLLRKIYFSPLNPASFTGDPKKLYQAVKLKLPSVTEKQVIKWLHQQHTYQLHKSSPNRRSVQYAQVVVPGPNHQLDMDLMYVTKIKNYNRSYNYLLVVVDVFSRKAYVAPLKVKTASATLEAFKGIIGNQLPQPPKVVRTDRGKEFEGCFDRFLRDHKIQHYWAMGKHKANYAERFIRTLRGKLLRYLTHQHSYRYIDALPELVQSYNNTYHRSIGMTPNEVTEKTAIALRNRLYGATTKPEAMKPLQTLQLGDQVRILCDEKSAFAKNAAQQWTEEYFEVYAKLDGNPASYLLKDMLNVPVRGRFTEQQLQLVEPNAADNREIAKVISVRRPTKTCGGGARRLLYKVRWKGWPDKFTETLTTTEYKRARQHRQ